MCETSIWMCGEDFIEIYDSLTGVRPLGLDVRQFHWMCERLSWYTKTLFGSATALFGCARALLGHARTNLNVRGPCWEVLLFGFGIAIFAVDFWLLLLVLLFCGFCCLCCLLFSPSTEKGVVRPTSLGGSSWRARPSHGVSGSRSSEGPSDGSRSKHKFSVNGDASVLIESLL